MGDEKHERAISQTAMLIASLRALAVFEDDPAIRGGDSFAELFLPEDKRQPLQSPEFRSQIKKMIPEGLYEYVIARTRHFDELFLQCLRNGFTQIVLLGAGYDSRPYRFAEQSRGAVIFEVDAAATQQDKRRILMDNGITVPGNVVYVPVDFEHDDLFRLLSESGYDDTQPSLFSWEGVTFYLSPQAVDAMLEAISRHAAPGSLLSFDFQHVDHEHGLIDTQLKDEQIKFGMDADACAGYLGQFGFSLRERLDAQGMESRYLVRSDGAPFSPVKPIMNIVTAEL
ncbi:MAG TPA: SAM-dependent methyltransferase [Anaerovoracaceae bacterium]|nr:SAM-dependent methyltransferase [Anaerovoracaceae bacterium]